MKTALYSKRRRTRETSEEESVVKLERETGIEPVTSSLGSWRSTAELLPPVRW